MDNVIHFPGVDNYKKRQHTYDKMRMLLSVTLEEHLRKGVELGFNSVWDQAVQNFLDIA